MTMGVWLRKCEDLIRQDRCRCRRRGHLRGSRLGLEAAGSQLALTCLIWLILGLTMNCWVLSASFCFSFTTICACPRDVLGEEEEKVAFVSLASSIRHARRSHAASLARTGLLPVWGNSSPPSRRIVRPLHPSTSLSPTPHIASLPFPHHPTPRWSCFRHASNVPMIFCSCHCAALSCICPFIPASAKGYVVANVGRFLGTFPFTRN